MNLSLEAAQDFWPGKKLRDKATQEVSVVIGVEDFGGNNQRITIQYECGGTSSVKLPAWNVCGLEDYEMVFRKS